MKKGKRLLVTLLAMLTVLVASFSVSYATVSHDIRRLESTPDSSKVNVLMADNRTIGTVQMVPDSNLMYDGEQKAVDFEATVTDTSKYSVEKGVGGLFRFTRTASPDSGPVGEVRFNLAPPQYTGTTAAGEDYDSSDAPIEAGTYTAKATLIASNSSGTQVGTCDIIKKFNINKKAITPVWSGDTFTYNGKMQVPELTFTHGGTEVEIPAYYYEVSYTKASDSGVSVDSPTDADKYNVEVTLTNTNFEWEQGAENNHAFTIAPKPIPVVWGDDTEFTYDGQNHAPSVSIDPNRVVSGDQVDVTTAGEKTAGEHTAKAVLTGTDKSNYVITDETAEQDFTIRPKKLKVTWKGDGGSATDFDFTYNAEEQGPTAELDKSGIVKGETCTLTVTGQGTNVGDYTASASLSNDNYVISEEQSSSTCAFSISKKNVSFTWDPTYTGPSDDPKNPELIYNGEAQGPVAKDIQGLIDGDDCSIEVSGQEITVGTYEATAELTGASKDNYNLTTPSTQRFDIVANTVVTLTWSPDSFVYNAKYQCPEAKVTTKGPMEEGKCELTYTVHKDTAEGEVVPEGEKMPVGTYVVTATLNDTDNFRFDEQTETEFRFEITKCPVTIDLDIESEITYDGQYHYPVPTLNTIYDVDKDYVKPFGVIVGKNLDGNDSSVILENDDYSAAELAHLFPHNIAEGVTHASSGDYKTTVVGLVGDESKNYELIKIAQKSFKIVPKPVTLDWFRPAYDAYGDETDEPPVKIDVDHGEKLKLVFNGKPQAPVAEVREGMLVKNADSGEMDVCKVTVSGSRDAVEASEYPYKATDIKFSNPDYTRDQNGADYYIIARPVKLAWDKTATTYNGKEQKRTVKITNIQKTKRGKDYSADEGIGVVKVSKITYTKGAHFGTAGTDTDESKSTFNGKTGYYKDDGSEEMGLAEGSKIAAGRTPTDAGTYVMTAAELSDPFNYTLVKIDPESIELDPAVIPNTEDEPWYVDNHHPIYKIHQYQIKKIDWRNTTVTYNASNQKPIAEVNKSNLQGPDTNKEVAVMIHADKNSNKDNFVGKCNAKTYTINVLKNDALRGIKGARCMNYFIGDSAQKMQTKFIIKKKPLTVTVYNKTGYYGDNPATYKHSVKYTGLINGKVNKDDNHQNKNIPGKYKNDAGVTKKVVEGTLKYTTNYKKWGKPGKYNIKASGLKSDNYAIKYVAGTLTIKDRFLAGDFVTKVIAGNKKGTIYWRRIKGAAKYQLYFSLCDRYDHAYTPKLYKTFGSKAASFKMTGLESHTYYKYYLVALDSNGKVLAKSHQHHFCTNDSYKEYTNPKSITGLKKRVTLKKGKTYKLNPTVNKEIPWKKLTNGTHTLKLRYKSGNNHVATVSSKGTIKAVGTGWCRVYAMAANGIWYDVEVTVK